MVIEDTGSELTWTYQTFIIAGFEDNYRLAIGGGVGTGFDAMDFHNGQEFSTYDNDNDISNGNCAFRDKGGWWYKNCLRANLNGPHTVLPNPSVDLPFAKLLWFDGQWRDISSSEMKIRVKQYTAPNTASC